MEEIEEYYDKKSESYDEVFAALYFRVYDAVTWRYVEPYVPVESDAVVLDAGGGTARWAIRMAEKGCKVVLMDSSEKMLRAAAKKVEAKGLQDRITLQKRNITNTGYADETFDMVLCEHALFLFKEPDVAIRELKRVLKKNAALVVSAQNRYVQALSSLAGKPRVDNVERAFKVLVNQEHECMTKDGKVKIYTWTPQEFCEMLERNGLRVEKIVGKVATMPLRVRQEFFMEKKHPQELFDKLLQFELALCEKPDALALAGHLQAAAFKL
jgi:ubiquinone/menaquinone biosynthesis C-methylase UbiE